MASSASRPSALAALPDFRFHDVHTGEPVLRVQIFERVRECRRTTTMCRDTSRVVDGFDEAIYLLFSQPPRDPPHWKIDAWCVLARNTRVLYHGCSRAPPCAMMHESTFLLLLAGWCTRAFRPTRRPARS